MDKSLQYQVSVSKVCFVRILLFCGVPHVCICNPETVRSKDAGISEESHGVSSGIMKMMGLRNSTKHDERQKNLKVSSLVILLSLC